MKKILAVGLIILLTTSINAQSTDDDSKKGMPNIPGTFLFDYGFNFLSTHAHDTLKTNWFGSTAINAYYLYEIKMGKSGMFTFNPGVGVGVDKIKFKDDRGIFSTIDATTGERNTVVLPLADQFADGNSFKKSKLAMTYIDVPLEIRYHANPDDKDRSFKLAVGARIGVLVNQKTKFKYTTVEDTQGESQDIKVKYHQKYDLNRFRYGTTLRVGIGAFNVFYYHNFSQLFQGDKGPQGTKISNYTIGLTISGF